MCKWKIYKSNPKFANDLVVAKEKDDMLKQLNKVRKKKVLEIKVEKIKIMLTEVNRRIVIAC